MYTIYLRTNKVNGKQYVGQTCNFRNRERDWNCLKKSYANKYIDEGRIKYGLNNFETSILAEVDTRDEALELEEYYINEFNTLFPNGYNICVGGKSNSGSGKGINNNNYGTHFTEEHRKKIGNAIKGIKRSEETKQKCRETNKGKHYSPKTEFPKRKVNQYDLYGNFIRTWSSFAEINRNLGYNQGIIVRCCKGGYFDKKKNKWINVHQSYGYIWKYADEN